MTMLAVRSRRLRRILEDRRNRYLSVVSDDYMNANEQDSAISAIRAGTSALGSAIEPSDTYGINRFGLFTLPTGSTSAGRCGFGLAAPVCVLTKGAWVETETEIRTGSTLSDAGQTYYILHGLTDDPSTVTPPNGIQIRYSHGVSSGQWEVWMQNGGTGAISVASGITVLADTWYRLRLWVDANNKNCRAWVNDVEIAVPTDGREYPAENTYGVGFYSGINKTVGNTSRNMIGDWLWFVTGGQSEIPTQ